MLCLCLSVRNLHNRPLCCSRKQINRTRIRSGATSAKRFRRRRGAPQICGLHPPKKADHGIELAQIQQKTVKIEYFAPSCCLVHDLASPPPGSKCWSFSTTGSSPVTSDKIGS